MNLTLSLLQQILSLPQEDALVPLDRYFDSEDGRELQLLGFLPPDERREKPQLVALTYDRRAYEEDWELERQRIRRPKPKTYRQMLTQNRQPSYHRPSLLEGIGKICLGVREIRIPASSSGDIEDAGVLLIARFLKAGVKAEQLGGDFQHQYLHRLSLDIPWQELMPLAKAVSQNPNEPVRLIPRKESEKVPARKRMTLSVGMKERAYTCTVEGREHHFWIEQVQLYDLWSDQEERIRMELEPLDTWQGYEALAKYLTKEPRELGKPEVGARNWAASLGLKKPKVESEIVKDNLTVAAPPGAVILSAPPPVRNEFGEFVVLKYYLPIRKKEEKKGTRPPRRRKRK